MNFQEKRQLKRLRKGDRDACIALIDMHYADVYRYLLGLCHREEQAADFGHHCIMSGHDCDMITTG